MEALLREWRQENEDLAAENRRLWAELERQDWPEDGAVQVSPVSIQAAGSPSWGRVRDTLPPGRLFLSVGFGEPAPRTRPLIGGRIFPSEGGCLPHLASFWASFWVRMAILMRNTS